MSDIIDEMINVKFNRLLVLQYDHSDKSRSKYYKCLCDCGNISIVKSTNLRKNITKSCGCLQKEIASKLLIGNTYNKKDKIQNYTKDVGGFIITDEYSLEVTNFIYQLTNKINGHIYIGKTNRTLKEHLKRYNRLLNTTRIYKRYIDKALLKYGLGNFYFKILEICSKEELNNKEKYYIQLYQSNKAGIGYNLTEGGEGTKGYKLTDVHKKNISISRIGKYCGVLNPFYGKNHTKETIQKIIESNIRRTGTKLKRRSDK